MTEQLRDADDAELLRRTAKGDHSAFRLLADRHVDRLYALAVTLVGRRADAEDVVQETLTGAFRGAGRFQERASVKTWLTRILVTQAALWRRQNRRIRLTRESDPEPVTGAGPGEAVSAKLDLAEALRQLSPEHREILVLREMEQMSYEQIGQSLGLPLGTVESRLHRARLDLKAKLAAYRMK